jgi:hypothetical protein
MLIGLAFSLDLNIPEKSSYITDEICRDHMPITNNAQLSEKYFPCMPHHISRIIAVTNIFLSRNFQHMVVLWGCVVTDLANPMIELAFQLKFRDNGSLLIHYEINLTRR